MLEPTPKEALQDNLDAIIGLLINPELHDIFIKVNKEYLYWDKVKYLAPKGLEPTLFWYAVKLQRRSNLQRLRFGKYTFCYNITPVMLELLHEFDLHMGGSLSSGGIIPERDKQVYLTNSIMEEAIASSQMEGASTTRKVAKEMLRKESRPINTSQQMILNNYQTIRQLVDLKNIPLNQKMLLDVHKSISYKTLDDPNNEGEFRKTDDIFVVNAITGDIAHTPPSYEEIEDILNDLYAFANDQYEDFFIHPIIKGTILHFILAWVHPFADGNGRTSRSLVYWYMLKKGYWLTEYLSISRIIYKNKKRYERMFLYTENDEMDMTYFILYNLNVMKQAYEDLKTYLSHKIEERNTILQYGYIEGVNERQMRILKLINDVPSSVLTAQEIANRFGVSSKTARTDLQTLADIGLLKQVSLNKKLSGYVKPDKNSLYMISQDQT